MLVLPVTVIEVQPAMDLGIQAGAGEADPRFPPIVRFQTFLSCLEALAQADAALRDVVLERLSDNDRIHATRALELFDIRSEDGQYDEVTLRRLTDPNRQQEAIRSIIRRRYAPQLALIKKGIHRHELEAALATRHRSSPSSLEKARQFLERAMEHAGMSTTGILRSPGGARLGTRPAAASRNEHTPGAHEASPHDRFLAQLQSYLDVLLERYTQIVDDTRAEERLEQQIETVSERIERLLSAHRRGGGAR